MDDKSDLTIRINRDAVGELYRMVQWWCHGQSNTFHYIKRAIEERYPATAEWNKVEFGFDKGQYGQRKHKENQANYDQETEDFCHDG